MPSSGWTISSWSRTAIQSSPEHIFTPLAEIKNQTESAQDLPRSGRSRITTQAKIGMPVCFIYVIQQSLLQSLLLQKVAQTVRNRLYQCTIRPKSPYVGPVLTNVQRRVRVRWCHILRVWTLKNWCRIWFSGESRFLLQRCDGRTREQVSKWVFRSCLRTINWQWAAISYNRRTIQMIVRGNLTAQRHKDDILPPHNYAQCYW